MEDNKYSRRKFVSKYIYGGTFLLGGALVFGCSSMKTAAKDNSQPVSPNGTEPLPQDVPGQAAQDTTKQNAGKAAAQQPPKTAGTAEVKSPCDDLTGVSPEELEKRKKFAYVTKSPIPDSQCSNCALYIPPGAGKPCGACLLFKGPVRAEAYCAYWAPISN